MPVVMLASGGTWQVPADAGAVRITNRSQQHETLIVRLQNGETISTRSLAPTEIYLVTPFVPGDRVENRNVNGVQVEIFYELGAPDLANGPVGPAPY